MFSYSDTIEDERIRLIPYQEEHVPMYNEWLKSAEIQLLTETEPCSLEEEYAYQKEWVSNNQATRLIKLIQVKESGMIVGDVNLFYENGSEAEINLMIADPAHRGQNYAKEALDLLFSYVSRASISKIIAKILVHNVRSIRFFEKYGFVVEGDVNAFDEQTLVYYLKKK